MGLKFQGYFFSPGENEQIETNIKIQEEKASIIHGVVKDNKNRVVKGAILILFEVLKPKDTDSLIPLNHTFSDENGHFVFGPVLCGKDYAIKVWSSNIKPKELVTLLDNNIKPVENENNSKGHVANVCENVHPKIKNEHNVDIQIDEEQDFKSFYSNKPRYGRIR